MNRIKIPHFGQLRRKLLQPRFSAREMKEVLAHYDLGQWRAAQTLGGGNSCNVVLETTAGKKVLKRYLGSLETIIIEHFVVNHLIEVDFPCPKLERNDEGSTYCSIDDKHYAVYDFIEGVSWPSCRKDPQLRDSAIKSAAQTLARLDDAMSVIKAEDLPGEKNLSARVWPGQLEEHLQLVDQYTEMACRPGGKAIDKNTLSGLLSEIRNDLTEAWHYYQHAEPYLPKQIVHYDYASKNLIFGDGRVVAVLDFGEARVDFRASDVARGLTSFAGKMRCANMDWHTASTFLKAYRSELPLHEKEIESLSDMIRWRLLGSILRIMEIRLRTNNRSDKAGFYRDPEVYIQKKWEYITELKEQHAEFQEFLVKAAGC